MCVCDKGKICKGAERELMPEERGERKENEMKYMREREREWWNMGKGGEQVNVWGDMVREENTLIHSLVN